MYKVIRYLVLTIFKDKNVSVAEAVSESVTNDKATITNDMKITKSEMITLLKRLILHYFKYFTSCK